MMGEYCYGRLEHEGDSPLGTKISYPSWYLQLLRKSSSPEALNLPSALASFFPSASTLAPVVGYREPWRESI